MTFTFIGFTEYRLLTCNGDVSGLDGGVEEWCVGGHLALVVASHVPVYVTQRHRRAVGP